jgi:hypothetical protein
MTILPKKSLAQISLVFLFTSRLNKVEENRLNENGVFVPHSVKPE